MHISVKRHHKDKKKKKKKEEEEEEEAGVLPERRRIYRTIYISEQLMVYFLRRRVRVPSVLNVRRTLCNHRTGFDRRSNDRKIRSEFVTFFPPPPSSPPSPILPRLLFL